MARLVPLRWALGHRLGVARAVALAALAGSLLLPARPAGATGGTSDITARIGWRYFEATGHRVAEPFLSFFDRYGTFSTFGHPITEAFDEDGRLVQYFQRARLEYWPENPERLRVQLANLGDLLGVPPEPPIAPAKIAPTAAYFPQTGHSVDGDFLDFIGLRGGTDVFGFPTTEPYLDAEGRLVQQFQRAILVLVPENPAEQRVQPRLLGDEFLARRLKDLPPEVVERVDPDAPRAAAAGPVPTLWGYAEENATGYMPEKIRNVARSFQWLDGRVIEPGQTFVFSRVLEQGGYELGLCYGAGGQYEWCEAGGACSGASTFYRAWTNAGLEVVSRQAHSVLPANPQNYGRDSTVYVPYVDLVVRNNSGTRLRISAKVLQGPTRFAIGIEGERGPEWTVKVLGPYRDGPLSFRVNYQKTFADGRVQDNWVTTHYYGYPPTYVPPRPS